MNKFDKIITLNVDPVMRNTKEIKRPTYFPHGFFDNTNEITPIPELSLRAARKDGLPPTLEGEFSLFANDISRFPPKINKVIFSGESSQKSLYA